MHRLYFFPNYDVIDLYFDFLSVVTGHTQSPAVTQSRDVHWASVLPHRSI